MIDTTLASAVWTDGFPSVAAIEEVDGASEDALARFLVDQRDSVSRQLHEIGAVLLRGFSVVDVDAFEAAAESLLGTLATYRGGDAPRRAERGNVYNAEGPDSSKFLRAHNELSYAPWYPTTLLFGCARPADSGGATVLWDGRRVFEGLSAEVSGDFRDRGVMYVQHLPHEAGTVPGVKSWQETFESDDRDEVLRHCAERYTSAVWTEVGLLTTNVTPGALIRDGRHAWFNQTHIWRKDPLSVPDVTNFEAWRTHVGYGALFGDATAIPDAHMDEVTRVLGECAVPVRWQTGDLLLVDNRVAMHGREPFEGRRQVFVAFA
jgi:alpha-ketoglutarate-dependent taurine dioxygenase